MSFVQQNQRRYPRKSNYTYSNCSILLGRKVGEKIDYLILNTDYDRENWVNCNLVAGDYILAVITPWVSFVKQSAVSVYGPSVVRMTQLKGEQKPKDFFSKAFLSHAQQNKLNWKVLNSKYPDIKFAEFNDLNGFNYLIYKNDSKDLVLKNTLDISSSMNMILFDPYQGLKTTMQIKPNSSTVIPIYQKIPKDQFLSGRFYQPTLRYSQYQEILDNGSTT